MLGERVRRLRHARGLSLDELVAATGGIVTKQAISKYEHGKAQPSPIMVNKLAAAFGVKSAELWSDPEVQVEFIAYRKRSGLTKKEQGRVQGVVAESLERRVRLQELTQQASYSDVFVRALPVDTVDEAEEAARQLRKKWRLGLDPIGSVTGVLEDHLIHVIELEASEKFDGIAAVARQGDAVKAAAVVSRDGAPGERQRLNLAHELAHLMMNVAPGVDEEKAAFRFAAAFLAPVEVMYREVGKSRASISLGELLLLKKGLGMSLQAILYRLKDLGIISPSHYTGWCRQISAAGWRKSEPQPLPREIPQWLNRSALRAVAEKVMTRTEAERLTGTKMQGNDPLSLVERRAFLRLPVEQRRQVMEQQADRLDDYYRQAQARGELDVADVY